jgi:hypothetical protein
MKHSGKEETDPSCSLLLPKGYLDNLRRKGDMVNGAQIRFWEELTEKSK